MVYQRCSRLPDAVVYQGCIGLSPGEVSRAGLAAVLGIVVIGAEARLVRLVTVPQKILAHS